MTTELIPDEQEENQIQVNSQGSSSGAVYGLGLIGAWVFYIGRATTPQDRIKGFFKGFIWPAFMVYRLLEFLDKE